MYRRQAKAISCIGTGLWLLILLLVPTLGAQNRSAGSNRASETPISASKELIRLLGPLQIVVPNSTLRTNDHSFQEIRIVWNVAAQKITPKGALSEPALQLVSRKYGASGIVLLRSAEIGREQLLIVAVDGNGVLCDWTIIQDPRFLRSEAAGLDGVLTGHIVSLPKVDFSVALSDTPTAVELRILEPHWVGGNIVLVQLATLPLGMEAADDGKR